MVEVIRAYTDKFDGKVHLVGEKLELASERAKELEEGGFVKVLDAPKEPTEQAPKRRGRRKADTTKE